MDLDHKHYFIIGFIILLLYVVCAKVVYKKIC